MLDDPPVRGEEVPQSALRAEHRLRTVDQFIDGALECGTRSIRECERFDHEVPSGVEVPILGRLIERSPRSLTAVRALDRTGALDPLRVRIRRPAVSNVEERWSQR
ncbi:hypothetical protein GCM10009706_05890 [Curtobacterium citreum]|nr:hypothetical protein GCM10009706_05890 [Curtobacterium citreum]